MNLNHETKKKEVKRVKIKKEIAIKYVLLSLNQLIA